ncbi:multidrug transporter [Hypoxylon texense]
MAPTKDEILAALAHYRTIVLHNSYSAFVRFVRHAETAVGPDDGLARLAGLDDWDVTAGWQCGQGPEATCFVIYCRNEDESKDWGWR